MPSPVTHTKMLAVTDVTAGGNAPIVTRDTQTAPVLMAGTGAPTCAAPKGSLYIRIDGTTGATRLHINTDGGTTWTNITAAA